MSGSDTGGLRGRARVRAGVVAGAGATQEERQAARTMLEMISGVHISRAVYVAAELGIADLLADGPLTVAHLAKVTQAHEPSLYRVLRLLASLGVLTEHDGRAFSLTVLGDRLRTDAPASMRSWAMLVDSIGGVAAFEPIIETVRTGRPGLDLAYGRSIFDYLASHPKREHRFQAAMSERTTAFAPSVATGYDFSRMRTVTDIGGGQGTLLAAILRAHTHLRGILLDLPSVEAGAASVLRDAGAADRCDIVTGDFFEGVPGGADAYILANVLHDWDDDRSVQILAACRRAMVADGRVLIVERLIPGNPADAVPVLLSDINMLVFTGGQERTNSEYRDLLAAAGLAAGQVHPVAPPYGIIEGYAA